MTKKSKKVKNVKVKPITNHDEIQIDIKKILDQEKKIKPEKIFEGFKTKTKTKNKKKY